MDADPYNSSWDAPASDPVPFEQLQPGVRYHVVIADC